MYTQCPSCASIFRLAPAHLREAGGQVRCGLCNEPFDALEALNAELPGQAAAARSTAGSGSPTREAAAPGVGQRAGTALEGSASVPGGAPPERPHEPEARAASPVPLVGAAAPAEPARAARPDIRDTTHAGLELPAYDPEDELEMPAPRRRRRPLLWGLAGLVAVLALLVQGAYLGRAELIQYPQLRPALQALCAVTGCELPLPREPGRIEVVQSEVSVHPSIAGLLQVRAVLRNPMEYPVAHPLLRLRFTDLSGEEIAQHSFRPAQYLTRRAQARGQGLMPGETLVLELEASDPGERAAAFELRLE
ncbi:zinc-ribbon and DUF3426 domain-containing protein [Alkalilimnicola sp. S0819]|uniref:zinc-ribbon and DUF3426 domain-containing protein n=1 Tax=Alkalilimnicola sp. S0819 TaxID=2613922 RepID=UPI00186A434A|nr:zinc-ribbon and DUF3426 domain-containing protein [Alkalilimnicola sp. S0819]